MWQRFTERSRRAVYFAQEEAGRYGASEVTADHLLLGILRTEGSVAFRILAFLDVNIPRLQAMVTEEMTGGEEPPTKDIQLSSTGKRAIDLAYDEARQLNNNHIGTEHLLLGIIRLGEGVANRALKESGIDYAKVEAEVRTLQANVLKPIQTPEVESHEFPRLDKRVLHLLNLAQQESQRQEQGRVKPEHLVKVLIQEERELILRFLKESEEG